VTSPTLGLLKLETKENPCRFFRLPRHIKDEGCVAPFDRLALGLGHAVERWLEHSPADLNRFWGFPFPVCGAILGLR
jgi:hypothetical protein